MTSPFLESKTQGSAGLCMPTAQRAEHLLHVSDERPACPMSTTSTDMLNASGENGFSAIGMLGAKALEVLEEDCIASHKVQFPEAPLLFHHQDYFEKIEKLQCYLDMVSKIVKPGCSEEVLNVALKSMSSVVRMLSMMSSTPFPHSSL